MNASRTLTLVAVLVLVLAACGDDDAGTTTTAAPTTTAATTTTEATTTTSSTAATTTTAAPTTTSSTAATTTTAAPPPFSGDTSTKGSSGITGSPGALTDIRIGEHSGYTRVVFDFEGSGEHWWTVGYVPDVVGGGSGEPCGVSGAAVLSVEAQFASAFWVDQTYFGPTEFSPTFDSSVVQVKFCEDFEAVLQVGIGVTGEKPFNAFVMQDPLRLVIDIAD